MKLYEAVLWVALAPPESVTVRGLGAVEPAAGETVPEMEKVEAPALNS